MALQPHERIIVNLDACDVDHALEVVGDLHPYVGFFMVGQPFVASVLSDLLACEEQSSDTLLKNLKRLFSGIGSQLFFHVRAVEGIGSIARKVALLRPAVFSIDLTAGHSEAITAMPRKKASKVFGVLPKFFTMRFLENLADAGLDGVICGVRMAEKIRNFPLLDAVKIACRNSDVLHLGARNVNIEYLIVDDDGLIAPQDGTRQDAAQRLAEELDKKLPLSGK